MKRSLSTHEKNLLRVVALVVLCTGFFIFHIWFRTLVLTKGYEVGASRRRVQELESQMAGLRVERNRLMGPDSLDRWVRDFAAQGEIFSAPKSGQLEYSSSVNKDFLPPPASRGAAR